MFINIIILVTSFIIIYIFPKFHKHVINLNRFVTIETYGCKDGEISANAILRYGDLNKEITQATGKRNAANAADLFLNANINGSLNKDKNLCRGDSIEYIWSCNEKIMSDYGIVFKCSDITYVVSGNNDRQVEDEPLISDSNINDSISSQKENKELSETYTENENNEYIFQKLGALYYKIPTSWRVAIYSETPFSDRGDYIGSYFSPNDNREAFIVIGYGDFWRSNVKITFEYINSLLPELGYSTVSVENFNLNGFSTQKGIYVDPNQGQDFTNLDVLIADLGDCRNAFAFMACKRGLRNKYRSVFDDIVSSFNIDSTKFDPEGINVEPYSVANYNINLDSPIFDEDDIDKYIYDNGLNGSITDENEFDVNDSYYENNSELSNVVDYYDGIIFPYSSKLIITDENIENLSDDELQKAINEIYARHGYIFKNDDIREYYEQYDWYYELVDPDAFSVNLFNSIEKKNISKLQHERENR